jgi:hypothetical protein
MPITNYLPSSRLIQPGVCTSSTRPASPFEGQVIYETNTKQTLVWQGTAWVMLTDADTPPGLQLIKTQTIGSGVASVTVTDVFSSEFDAYKIVATGVRNASTQADIQFRLNNASVGYYGAFQYVNVSNNSFAVASLANAAQWSWVGSAGNPTGWLGGLVCDVINPFATGFTGIAAAPIYYSLLNGSFQGIQDSNVSHTGFILLAGSGTLTGGTIRVYGYRNTI